jgi:hypothetical protein
MRHIPEALIHVDDKVSPPAALPSRPFGDVPGSIWTAFLGAWALLFGLFLVFFTKSGPATMAVITACFFALMLLGLPAALSAQAGAAEQPLATVIHTHTGPVPVRAAATQILLIPATAVVGLVILIIAVM